ncbi:GAF domain-containing protein [Streptomyces sp. NPDC051098]|uniref:GAF domain-containing protein n=1 Tax=Streptomyces sp. NPDC051098 TaxID=3155411 RepID=UPI0034266CBD
MFQNQTDQGPCIDCWRTGERLSAPDFSRRQNEWPYFVPLARAAGFEGAYAIPLRIRRRTVGALNLLTSAPAPLPAEELALMQALGDVTVTALMQWNGDPLRPERTS